MTEEQYNNAFLPYWINTCYMCGKEFKVAKSWVACRRFCSFECKQDWRKKEKWYYK